MTKSELRKAISRLPFRLKVSDGCPHPHVYRKGVDVGCASPVEARLWRLLLKAAGERR